MESIDSGVLDVLYLFFQQGQSGSLPNSLTTCNFRYPNSSHLQAYTLRSQL